MSFSPISFKKLTKFGSNFSNYILCLALLFICDTKSFNVVFILFDFIFFYKSTPKIDTDVLKDSKSTNYVLAVSINYWSIVDPGLILTSKSSNF